MSLLEVLAQNIDGQKLQQISQAIGAEPTQTKSAMSAALPMLVGALAKNANTPQGAEALAGALDRDHDGSILDNLGSLLGGGGGGGDIAGALGGLLGGGGGDLGGLLGAAASMLTSAPGNGSAKTVDGAGILGHILGGKQGAVTKGVSKASGLNGGQVTQLLITLAPLVMGALGKSKQSQGLDAGGLAGMLGQASGQLGGGAGGGLLGSLLDKDDDGSIADDVAQLAGKQLLGSLFG